MKIAITHTDFRLYWPARIAAFYSLLRQKGHSLVVIEIAGKGSPYSFAEPGELPGQLDWVCLFPERKMESISGAEASAALFAKLDAIQPDIVFAGAIAFPSGATAVRWCRLRGKRVVIFDDARLQDVPRSWLVNFIKRIIYANVDAVLCPANSHTESFQFWGVPVERTFFGLNVVDNRYFSERTSAYQRQRDILKNELSLPASFFLGVGRCIDIKNWLDVLHAYIQAKRVVGGHMPHLVLIGDGPEKDQLAQIVAKEGIKEVHLLPFCQQETLCKYYALAEALILASSGETWGLVINEAMASGLPVFVSRECGCAESLVEEGGNGFLFDAGDRSALTQALIDFCILPEGAKQNMGKRSAEIISQWGLERFSQGAWQAVKYAQAHPLEKNSPLDALLLALWKGRYRPV